MFVYVYMYMYVCIIRMYTHTHTQTHKAHLEYCNQQSEREVRKLEEKLVMREEAAGAETGTLLY